MESAKRAWIEDLLAIVLLVAVFHFAESLSVYVSQQWLGYLPPWEAKPKVLTLAVAVSGALGILLGILSPVLLHSKRYVIAACPPALVAMTHLSLLPKLSSLDPLNWSEAIRCAVAAEASCLLPAIAVAATLTAAKHHWDFSLARQIIIRVGVPALSLGVGIYAGWGSGRASIAAPDLVFDTRLHLSYLALLEAGDNERLRDRLEGMLDTYALAMPIWRKAVLSSRTKKNMDDAVLRIARYRQQHPKQNDCHVGTGPYAWQLLEFERDRDRKLHAIYRKALEAAPPEASDKAGSRQQTPEDQRAEHP